MIYSFLVRESCSRRSRWRNVGFAWKNFSGRICWMSLPFSFHHQARKCAMPNIGSKWPAAPLDGVIAKRSDLPYQAGARTACKRSKNYAVQNCVVGVFRYAAEEHLLGSLLLGLYDEQGLLHPVGFTSGFRRDERKALLKKLEPLIKPPGVTGNAPGGSSRWSTNRSSEWQPLSPKLVVEIRYDHFTGNRFRHGTKFLRWRPDKAPKACSMDQVKSTGRAF